MKSILYTTDTLMETITLLAVAIALAMDVFAIVVACELANRRSKYKLSRFFKVSGVFGAFHTFMPLLGCLLGVYILQIIEQIDHWLAFLILLMIGLKMIYETSNEEKCCSQDFGLLMLLQISFVTSIDALSVGITLPFQFNISPYVASFTIGLTTFVISFSGFFIAHQIKTRLLTKWTGVVGGMILIFIGIKILAEHTLFS